MPKQIAYDSEAREKLKRGVDQLAKLVTRESMIGVGLAKKP